MMDFNSLDHMDPLLPGALRHHVVRRLLAAIIQRELPADTRLVAKKLAERLGVSPTPIREALVELEQVGVVQLLHNRGAVVMPFGPRQLHEFFHVRRILESEAVRCATPHIDKHWTVSTREETQQLLKRLHNATHSTSADFVKANRRFHGAISQKCSNARLANELQRYDVFSEAIIQAVDNSCSIQQAAMGHHLEVIDAIDTGDADAAALAMAHHLMEISVLSEQVIFGDS
jgi:DNA-binding GntR family transcriptional regulator